MNLFQYLALPVTGGLLLWNLFRLITGKQSRGIALLGAFIWLAASVAILSPDLTMEIADFFGIGRGADLLLYILAISFLSSMFFIYQRLQRIESNITEIARYIALHNAYSGLTPDAEEQEDIDYQPTITDDTATRNKGSQ